MRIISEVTPLAYAKQYLRQELFGSDSMEDGDSLYCRDTDLQLFLESCIAFDYEDRPSADELLSFPFL